MTLATVLAVIAGFELAIIIVLCVIIYIMDNQYEHLKQELQIDFEHVAKLRAYNRGQTPGVAHLGKKA